MKSMEDWERLGWNCTLADLEDAHRVLVELQSQLAVVAARCPDGTIRARAARVELIYANLLSPHNSRDRCGK